MTQAPLPIRPLLIDRDATVPAAALAADLLDRAGRLREVGVTQLLIQSGQEGERTTADLTAIYASLTLSAHTKMKAAAILEPLRERLQDPALLPIVGPRNAMLIFRPNWAHTTFTWEGGRTVEILPDRLEEALRTLLALGLGLDDVPLHQSFNVGHEIPDWKIRIGSAAGTWACDFHRGTAVEVLRCDIFPFAVEALMLGLPPLHLERLEVEAPHVDDLWDAIEGSDDPVDRVIDAAIRDAAWSRLPDGSDDAHAFASAIEDLANALLPVLHRLPFQRGAACVIAPGSDGRPRISLPVPLPAASVAQLSAYESLREAAARLEDRFSAAPWPIQGLDSVQIPAAKSASKAMVQAFGTRMSIRLHGLGRGLRTAARVMPTLHPPADAAGDPSVAWRVRFHKESFDVRSARDALHATRIATWRAALAAILDGWTNLGHPNAVSITDHRASALATIAASKGRADRVIAAATLPVAPNAHP